MLPYCFDRCFYPFSVLVKCMCFQRMHGGWNKMNVKSFK